MPNILAFSGKEGQSRSMNAIYLPPGESPLDIIALSVSLSEDGERMRAGSADRMTSGPETPGRRLFPGFRLPERDYIDASVYYACGAPAV